MGDAYFLVVVGGLYWPWSLLVVALCVVVLTLQSSVNYVSLQVDLLSLEFDLRGEMLTVAIQGSAFWISLHGGFVGALSYPLLDSLTIIVSLILGLAFSIDAPDWWTHGEGANPMMFTKKLMFLRGEVDPVVFIKKLFKAKIYAMLYRIDYGHEENPQGIRKPNNHFLRFRFEIDMLEGSWYKKIIGALKTIQGVSFTIDAPSQMVYMCGNIEEGLLLKMLTKTGIQILGMDYGNLKPPPKKVEAQISDGTETQPKKDTEPPPEIVVTKHQAKNKKPRGFKVFCCP
ncbi:unnamed protein product [Brassica oleracea]|uniref:(rape) hypothetical protein n=1 Tax=Brassica napus TaxID=3708 RepID=A0A816J5X2_BRANA|nr:unnamed protein product [Brassica napus]